MTGRYKAYPEYKDSFNKSLGNIPKHWSVKRLKYVTNQVTVGVVVNPSTYFDDNGPVPFLRGIDISRGHIATGNVKKISHASNIINSKSMLHTGDLVSMRVGYPGVTAVIPKELDGANCASLVIIRKPKQLSSKLVCYQINTECGISQIKLLQQGAAQEQINVSDIVNFEVVCPPTNEASIIANFLDHETAKIDTLITKQEKLIELLKEKRQAVISHAVTKGLNPDAPMKDSGVEWLGKVPEHWGKIAFKQVIKTRKGVAFSTSDFCDSGIRVVKASDIKQLSLNQSDVFLPKDFITKYPKAYLTQGNIILSTVGSTPDVKNSAVGQIAIVPKELDKTLLNQNTVVFDPIGNAIDRHYLFFLLQTRAYRDHLDLHAHGTANQASLNVADMLDFKCFTPSTDEQKLIAMYLYKFLDTVSNLETKAVNAIQLMKERKTALISAAVTGKIDVRDWAVLDEIQG